MLFALVLSCYTTKVLEAPQFLMMKYRIMLDCQIKDIKILTVFGK